MNRKINTLVLLLALGLTVSAQKQPVKKISKAPLVQAKTARPIKIGEQVPDAILTKIVAVDGSVSSAKLSDYDDKLLILDFMYTSCTACIAGLVKKNHLQQQFGNQIKIMVVIGGEGYVSGMLKRENEDFIRKFLTNEKSFLSRRGVQIPWVVENKLLNDYFPHILVSHLVWIYKGKLIAVTEQDYVTAENIQLVLDGKTNNWPVKNDFMPAVDVNTPLLMQNKSRFTGEVAFKKNENPASKSYAAIFGAYQNGVETKSGTVRDSVKHTRRDYIINLPILNIYTSRWAAATGKARFFDPSRKILEVKDPDNYVKREDSKMYSFVSRNKVDICYEAMGPDTGQTDQQVAMATIKNLDNLLGLHGRYENRKMKCLTLVRTDSASKFRSVAKVRDSYQKDGFEIFHKQPFSNFIWSLNQEYGNPPVFDGSGYSGDVDLDLKVSSLKDIPAVRKALQEYGLDLKEEERELEVFVLTEKSVE